MLGFVMPLTVGPCKSNVCTVISALCPTALNPVSFPSCATTLKLILASFLPFKAIFGSVLAFHVNVEGASALAPGEAGTDWIKLAILWYCAPPERFFAMK